MIRSTDPIPVRPTASALTALLLVALLAAAPPALGATAADSTIDRSAHETSWTVSPLDWLQRSVGFLFASSGAEMDDGALVDPDQVHESPSDPVSSDTPGDPTPSGEDGPFIDPHG